MKLRRFINSFDYSLDLIKLEQVFEAAYRRKGLIFTHKGKQYSKYIINVTFKYSYKRFNRVVRYDNTTGTQHSYFIGSGYRIEDLTFENCIAFVNGELAGVEVDCPIGVPPVSDARLGEVFRFDDQEQCYRIVPSKNETLMNRKQLREALYTNGFYCDSRHYVRFKRSSGSSRIGKCLFIDDTLSSRMKTWEKCGLNIRKDQKIDLAAWEAYISLTTSSIIDTLEIRPENILLIDDYKSVFTDRMLAVGLDGEWLDAKPAESEISNCIWDGQSLLDSSMFQGYENRGMLLLRTRFFKSACFNTNIQQFFKDNGITDVAQLNGHTRATKIEDIKLITTPSSLKYLKFGTFDEWLNRLEPTFGIVKYDKPSHYFNGEMVQCHYQLLNTLHMSYEDTEELLKPSYEYFKLLDNDPAVFRYHTKCAPTAHFSLSFNTKNELAYYFLGINKDFAKTRIFHDWKQDILRSFKKELKFGHILIPGTYATLFGNPYEMLLQSIGRFDGTSVLGQGNISCSMFEDGAELLGSRSPHVAAGNILVTRNRRCSLIDTYFNLSKYIVCINSIKENILERLSGADMDSDTMLITSDPLLVRKAKEHYEDFLVPTKLVPVQAKARRYTNEDKADLDHTTANNCIGEIVNLSQELNSLFWDKVNHGAAFDDVADIYNDIAKLDVLSNIEIDRAKRECVVDSGNEMSKIRKKYAMENKKDKRKLKPHFFAFLARRKGYYDASRNYYKHHATTMDYVHEIVTKWRTRNVPRKNLLPFTTILKLPRESAWLDYDKAHALFRSVQQFAEAIQFKWLQYSRTHDRSRRNMIVDEIVESTAQEARRISSLDINPTTYGYIFRHLEDPEYSKIRNTLMRLLFTERISSFTEFLRENEQTVPLLKRDKYGDIMLYGIPHSYDYRNLQKNTKISTFAGGFERRMA